MFILVHGAGRNADDYYRSRPGWRGARRSRGYVNETLGGQHTVTVVPLCGHHSRCIFTSDEARAVILP